MASLLELAQEVITSDIARKASGLVGETPAATESALRRAAPAVLAGVVNLASTPAGAERVRSLITEGGWGADVLGALGSRLAGGSGTGNFLSSGARLVVSLFGTRADGLTELLATGGGVQRGSASTILALAAPIVMSVVGSQVASRGLSTSGLSTMLAGERTSLLGAVPVGITSLLGLKEVTRAPVEVPDRMPEVRPRGVSAAPERFDPEPAAAAASSPLSRWWPALLVGLAAVAMLFLLTRGRPADVASMRGDVPSASPRQMADLVLPDGTRVSVSRGGSVHQLSAYLAGAAADLPKRFVFADLHFESGSTRLTPDGRQTVDALLGVLKAYPAVRVDLEGHTDATGDAAANKALSQQRAEAVKQILTAGGIAADRLKAKGYGQERPLAENTTETGRARNRRLELVVVQR